MKNFVNNQAFTDTLTTLASNDTILVRDSDLNFSVIKILV